MFQSTNRPSRAAAVGIASVGIAVAISSLSIGRAELASPAGSVSYTCKFGAACVEGDSTGKSAWGVYGTSAKTDGVHGTTSATTNKSGVAGISTSTTGRGHGVYGKSSNGEGVYGTSSFDFGVEGVSSVTNGAGVYGNSAIAYGVLGESANNTGSVAALGAYGDKSNTSLLYAYNLANSTSCTIDWNANLDCTGKIGAKAIRARHQNSRGQHVLTYAAESATATIEDVGTARMFGGVANVQIDPAFASVMDNRWYYVFLTPLADTRGLYVSMKTPSSFQVRENEHGRSSLTFDYRIVAHPLDAENDRLPIAPVMKMPRVPPVQNDSADYVSPSK